MRWRKIPNRLLTALRLKGTPTKDSFVTERSGKTLAYTVVIALQASHSMQAEMIKQIVLLNPWSAVSSPQITFDSSEGKSVVNIMFHAFSEEKGKIIENKLREMLKS